MELLDFQPIKTYTQPHRLALWNVGPYRTIVEAHTDQQRDDAVASMGVDPQTDEEWALVLASFYGRTDINWQGAEPYTIARPFFYFDREVKYYADAVLLPIPYQFYAAGFRIWSRRIDGRPAGVVWVDLEYMWYIEHLIEMWKQVDVTRATMFAGEGHYKIANMKDLDGYPYSIPVPVDNSSSAIAKAAAGCAKTIYGEVINPRYNGGAPLPERRLRILRDNATAFADYVDLLRKEA